MPSWRWMRSISSSISSRPCGSRPFVGSSRKTSSGIVDDRLGQLDPLLHPGRKALDQPVSLLVEPDVVEDVRRPLPRRAARQPAHLRHVRDEIGRRGAFGQRIGLRHVADAIRSARPPRRHVAAEHAGAAPVVALVSPSKIRSSVDFPAPFGPRSPTEVLGHRQIDAIERQDCCHSVWSAPASRYPGSRAQVHCHATPASPLSLRSIDGRSLAARPPRTARHSLTQIDDGGPVHPCSPSPHDVPQLEVPRPCQRIGNAFPFTVPREEQSPCLPRSRHRPPCAPSSDELANAVERAGAGVSPSMPAVATRRPASSGATTA